MKPVTCSICAKPHYAAKIYITADILAYLVEPVMRLSEKTLSAHPTDILMPYLLFSNTLSDTSALKLSIIAIPASPLSWA